MTNQSRGFVQMPDNDASRKAIAAPDGASVDNRTSKVMEARPKEERPGGKNGFSKSSFNKGFNKNRW